MNLIQSTCLVAFGLLAAGCGGGADDVAPPAVTTRISSSSGPGPTVAALPVPQGAAAGQSDAMPLRDWLGRLAGKYGLRVAADPSIAAQPVSVALPMSNADDGVKTALGDFDLLLGYTRHAGGHAALASVQVLPRGGLAARAAARRAEPAAEVRTPAAEADPEQRMLSVQQDLASTDAAVRSQALARSFQLEAPLPEPTLIAAMQGDASAEVRLYALMALARHPAVEPEQRRTLAQLASQDADPAVRAHAAEIVARIDADQAAP